MPQPGVMAVPYRVSGGPGRSLLSEAMRLAASYDAVIAERKKRATDGVSVTLDIGRAWRQAMARTGLRSH